MKPWTNFANYQRGPRISSREEVGTGGGAIIYATVLDLFANTYSTA